MTDHAPLENASSPAGLGHIAALDGLRTKKDPYEIENRISDAAYGDIRKNLTKELRKLVAEAAGV